MVTLAAGACTYINGSVLLGAFLHGLCEKRLTEQQCRCNKYHFSHKYEVFTYTIYKKRNRLIQLRLAERQGFEPWDPQRGSTVFETAPIDHSGISPSPSVLLRKSDCKNTTFLRLFRKKIIIFNNTLISTQITSLLQTPPPLPNTKTNPPKTQNSSFFQ